MSTNFDELFNTTALEALSANTGSSFPKIDCEGQWLVKVIESTYGKNQAGTSNRTLVKVEIIANIGESADKVTARTNLYINVGSKQEHTVRNFGPWIKTLIDAGVTEDKIKYDAVDHYDILQNIATILTKQIKLGNEIVLKLVTKDDGKGGLYKNVYVHTKTDPAIVSTSEVSNIETKAVTSNSATPAITATTAKPTKAPKVTAVTATPAPEVVAEDVDEDWLA